MLPSLSELKRALSEGDSENDADEENDNSEDPESDGGGGGVINNPGGGGRVEGGDAISESEGEG